MRIIRKSRLRFIEGKSDKVYEVDLCEAPSGERYVVNFRYGRFGGSLREGTKTAEPVALDRVSTITQFDGAIITINDGSFLCEKQPSPQFSTTAAQLHCF